VRSMRYAASIAALLLCGCIILPDGGGDSTVVVPPKPDTPDVVEVKAKRSDLCEQLALHIDGGRIKTTDDLVRVIQLLSDSKNWSREDSAAVDAVLPNLTGTNRVLTVEDSAKLRTVK
jgi:hypothetical protein